jgi:hypothetical protein
MNIEIKLIKIPSNKIIVIITAIVFLNFNRVVKNLIIGLPINVMTPAIAIYTKTSLILYKKKSKMHIPERIAIDLIMPLLIIFELVVFNVLFLSKNN